MTKSLNGTTLTESIASVVREHPNRLALWAKGETRSYRELWNEASSLAATLLQAGVTQGDRVAFLSYRTVTAYASIVGILRAGCTYVPLNPRFPLDRNRAILKAAGATALIIDRECAARFTSLIEEPSTTLKVIVAPEADQAPPATSLPYLQKSDLARATDRLTWPQAQPNDLAYLLFTSGSTGAPKGVPITHANVLAYLSNLAELTPVRPEDRLVQLADLTFDISVHDMFLAWTSGAAVISMPENSGSLAVRYIQEQGITGWFSVPSVIGTLRQAGTLKPGSLSGLRFSHFCGEALPNSHAEAWAMAAPNGLLFNLYGPTEATVAFSAFRFQSGRANAPTVVPIGRPFKGQMMGLFENGAPIPEGSVGEICLAGSQLTEGYWEAPGLNADRFMTINGVRWYRTGDLGVWHPEDGYRYAGRTDHQVKIRGYRVEGLEIEGELRRASGRDLVAAVPWPLNAGGNAEGVVGFVAGPQFDTAAVLQAMRGKLPDYMVPDRLIPCAELPLNANGKVDYKALAQRLSSEVVAFDLKMVNEQRKRATGPVEDTLMMLWEEVLGKRPSNPNANFFEVGGQSLKAVRLVSEMRRHFGRHLPVSLVFREPTVAGMARYLRGEVDDPSSVIPINDQGERPPFFAGGSSREYRDLSRALPNQPFFQLDVYSLQERRALAGEAAYTNVQDMAAHFLADIQLIQPTGPYHLGGQCDGGIVILELALQLQRQGQEVALLAQFDTPATGNFRKLPAPQRLSWLLRNGQLPSRILDRLSNGLWQDPATPQDRQHREIWEQIWAAVDAYEPSRPFDGEIQLFRAMETYGVFEDVSVGWERRATRGVRIHDVPGNHYQFFQNADAQEIVAAVIERADRKPDRLLRHAASVA